MATINIGAKVAIATQSDPTVPDPQPTDLDEAGFGALANWSDIDGVVTHGDTGVSQNFVQTNTWDGPVAEQDKGAVTGNQADITIIDRVSDGRTAMDAAASITDNNAYALRITFADGRIEYNRSKIGAPSRPKGGNEDVATVVYPTVAVQEPVTVAAP